MAELRFYENHFFNVLEGNNLREILSIPRQTSTLGDGFYVELWLNKGFRIFDVHALVRNNLRKILPIPRQTSALGDAFYVELWLN